MRAESRRGRGRRGVTVFEAAAAMAIVGLVAIGALEAVAAELRAADRSRRAVEASALVQQRLDWLDFLNETNLRSLPDSVKEGKFDPPLDEYRWQTVVTPVSTTPGLYDVQIKVMWPDSGAFQVRTYAYRRPVISQRNGGGAR